MFAVIADKVAGLRASEITLDGKWRIQPSPPKDFEQTPGICSKWGGFDVPGQWLQQGYDIPMCENIGLAREFKAPESWAGKRIFLRFDAIHGDACYWLNEEYLGRSENLFTPVEFDVTDALRPGEANYLALVMEVETTAEIASFSSGYAFHNLGGIDRSVRLFALPEIHIRNFACNAGLEADYRTGTLSLDLDIVNAAGQPADVDLQLQLFAPDGAEIAIAYAKIEQTALAPGATSMHRDYSVGEVLPWCDEKPNLYRLRVALYRDGKLQEQFEETVGFRMVELRGTQLLINGTPVKLAGICRHEVDPLSGRANTVKWAEEDARLLKEANFNYIRTSHYPPTREFMQACDRVGLYVECEGPFCWMHSGRGEREPEATDVLVHEFDAMLAYHRNHPSIIVWSIANESGAMSREENELSPNFKILFERCRQQDPTRLILFNSGGFGMDGGDCDIAVVHYPSFPVEDFEGAKEDPRPILLDEYFPPQMFIYPDEFVLNPGMEVYEWATGHNSNDSYWHRMYSSERIIGGAIWTALNDEFYMPDGSIKGYGDWGFIDGWRRRKSIWWDAKLVHSPFWIPVRSVSWKPGQTEIKIPVHNRYAFTDLNELTVRWELAGQNGECKVSVPPGETGEIKIPVALEAETGSLLVLRAFNKEGQLITAHGVTLGEPARTIPAKAAAGCPEYSDDEDAISIRGDGFDLEIAKPTGRVRWSGAVGGLLRFPILHVARKESRNVFNIDGLGRVEYPDMMKRVVERVEVEPLPEALRIAFHDHYGLFKGHVEMVLDKTGGADVSFKYVYTGEKFSVSELGLRFPMHGDCDEISWRRNSEWDVYPDDHIGRPSGSAKAVFTESLAAIGKVPVEPPAWPWCLDMNRFGTRDFRAAKYNIISARLVAADGFGIQINSDGSSHVRANVARYGIDFHTLLNIRPPGIYDPLRGWVYEIDKDAEITGEFHVGLLTLPQ